MPIVINLRGPGGSGKTSTIREFADIHGGWFPIYSGERQGKTRVLPPRILGYETADGIRVVGSYEVNCGGCDTIKEQQTIEDLVEAWADEGHDVVFEGLLVSSVFGRWQGFCHRLEAKGHTYVWAFINTPFDTCVERILHRNGGKPISMKVAQNHWKITQSLIKKTDTDEFISCVLEDSGGDRLERVYQWAGEHQNAVR